MSRFVFDTNVIVSAVLFDNSVPGQAFVKALKYPRIFTSDRHGAWPYDGTGRGLMADH